MQEQTSKMQAQNETNMLHLLVQEEGTVCHTLYRVKAASR